MNVFRPLCTCALCAALVLPAHADCHEPCHDAGRTRTAIPLHQPHVPESDYVFTLHARPAQYALVSSNTVTATATVPYESLAEVPEAEEQQPVIFSLDGMTFHPPLQLTRGVGPILGAHLLLKHPVKGTALGR